MPKVLIADDHPLFRDAIKDVVRTLFARNDWPLACFDATEKHEVLDTVHRENDLDLILLDLFMPGASGLSLLIELRGTVPATPIVVVSALADPATVQQAITCGAAGFIPKSLSKDLIVEALQLVLDGGIYIPSDMLPETSPAAERDGEACPLTPRQIAVLALLADGKSNKEIARGLDISEMTVKVHMTAILRKLGVSTRAQAIVAFQRDGTPRQ